MYECKLTHRLSLQGMMGDVGDTGMDGDMGDTGSGGDKVTSDDNSRAVRLLCSARMQGMMGPKGVMGDKGQKGQVGEVVRPAVGVSLNPSYLALYYCVHMYRIMVVLCRE